MTMPVVMGAPSVNPEFLEKYSMTICLPTVMLGIRIKRLHFLDSMTKYTA
jgi:hypothetical protein